MNKTIECYIEKLLPEGGGLSQYRNQPLEVYNALPGERVQALVFRKKHDRYRGIATEILQASPCRQKVEEDHYLSCSPWQIMDFASENLFKTQLAKEMLQRKGYNDISPSMIAGENRFQYRNKMEFNFISLEGQLSLAFYQRDSQRKIPISGCILSRKEIQETSSSLLHWLNQNKVQESMIKTLLVRSNREGDVLAGLFVNEENFPNLGFPDIEHLKGFHIYFSNPCCPASVLTKELFHHGESFLTETLYGKKLQYGIMSFFQINVDLFSLAIGDIKPFVEGEDVLDCYSGVGSISLSLSNSIQSCFLMDNCEEAILLARENILKLEIEHFHAIRGETETLLDYIKPHKVLIVDPPRTGLHKKVVSKILQIKPKRIIYLSCNMPSCLENIACLEESYNIVFSKIYNFFPSTAHFEFLIVLEKKVF